jgi:geranylgeranyl pyrophosphate synthase
VADALRAIATGREPCDHEQLRGWLDGTGSIEYAVSVASTYVTGALEHLGHLPPGEARSALQGMAEFIIQRKF